MRVAIIGFLHESNTFASSPTTIREFQSSFLSLGQDVVTQWGDAHHEIGGMLEGTGRENFDIIPIIGAWGTPGGVLTRETYEEIWQLIEAGVRAAGRLDGILLALHGSMVAEHLASADGETCSRLRRLVGPHVPIVMTLDMHANISAPMISETDATLCYKTYPHVDQREIGREAASLLARIVREGIRPRQHCIKLPMLIHIARQYTGSGAMKALMERVREVERRAGILSVSLAPGYIYADVPHMGVSVLCVANGDEWLARAAAEEIAGIALARREELNTTLPGLAAAVEEARFSKERTICFMDCGDNIGAGGPGDSTVLLHAVNAARLTPFCGILYDPHAADRCRAAGIGQTIDLMVGGRQSGAAAAPLHLTGVVRFLHDGKFTEAEPRHGGHRFLDQGYTAVVERGDGSIVVLNSLRIMPTSLAQLTSLGIEPQKMRAIIVKGATAPLAAYGPLGEVIQVDSEGVTRAGPELFVYTHRPRPLFPLDGFEPTLSSALRFT